MGTPMRLSGASLHEITGVMPASRLQHPPATMTSCGVAAVDALTGGLPRGCLTEIYGSASSGRSSLMMAALAAATTRGELCALVDIGDSFDPKSAEAAGVILDRILWVRCGEAPKNWPDDGTQSSQINFDSENYDRRIKRALEARQHTGAIMPAAKVWYGRSPARSERTSNGMLTSIPADRKKTQIANGESWSPKREWKCAVEQALKTLDLILQSGGFGVVVLDIADVPAQIVRRIPLTSWFRFRRAVENTPTVLLTIGSESYAKTCASIVLRTTIGRRPFANKKDVPSHTHVFCGIETVVELVRSRMEENVAGKK